MERLIGNNLTKFNTPANFVVIDIETTGLQPETCQIIEFAAIKVVDHKVVATYSELINPETSISPAITKLTGITNYMVKDKRTISEVAIDIHNFIGDSILLGQNVLFDIRFIYDNLLRELGVVLNNDYVDTMWLARYKLKKNIPDAKLGTLSKYLDCPFDGQHHRALADCDVTFRVYEKLIKL
ncbi:MAG: 3'-5' exonuclease [Erysipelotrichales bacterium]|nr:3'-5' exonuclease [Erysipelotrichales bacterium]